MWIGLALMHILFAREHNAICRRLHEVYPRWPGRRVYETARLINAALMAKIHTVDWTPAVIAHPTTVRAIGVTWSGLLGERFRRRFGRIGRGELLSGVPGSRTDLYGVPYALTEEFVTVYRMHPLIPDHFAFRSCADDTPVEGANGERELGFGELAVGPHDLDRPRAHLEAIGLANALYSLGTSLPGQITLHNFPQALREFTTLDGRRIDLAAIDIVRARECAVPRYNDFRRQLRLAPAASFADLTDDPAWAAQIREVYENDIEAVDTMVGLFGEPKPPGFAFSDTAFRIFLLMATRRLQSDRFFTRDFTPETYTPVGLRWIADNRMIDVLARHFGELAPALRTVGNPFQPWGRVWARG
jgi:hypothetical protein